MMMIRIVLFGTICLTAAAQTTQSLSALEQVAQKAETDWLNLAQNLDARLTRFLPCDARATSAIQEVSSASATRLDALANYMRALVEGASADTVAARQLVAAEGASLSAIPVERSDIAQELAGVESQILNLAASVRQRESLMDALAQLQELQTLVTQRAATAGELAAAEDKVLAELNALVTALQAREEALRQQAAAFESERARWNAFYTARADRARVECSVTGGGQ